MNLRSALVYWHEGQFLTPHHFQAADRRLLWQEIEQAKVLPYNWGIDCLKLDEDAFSKQKIKINEAKLRLPNGIWLDIKGNAYNFSEDDLNSPDALKWDKLKEAENSFANWFANTLSNKRPLSVYLGVNNNFNIKNDDWSSAFRNITIKKKDENSSENSEEEIQLKIWAVNIFFDDTHNHKNSIKIGEITPSKDSRNFSTRENWNSKYTPPLLKNGEQFKDEKLIHTIFNGINTTIEKEIKFDQDSNHNMVKILQSQILKSYMIVINKLLGNKETKPWDLYIELVRMLGSLSTLYDHDELSIEDYNHNDINGTMDALKKQFETIIDKKDKMIKISTEAVRLG
ncbi:MAG: type VI secretion system baseplate subunit TssK [Desulfamplus sp.]|nr:type VI secretion system baseplate subunit TssK [Desulfamplus sp.]